MSKKKRPALAKTQKQALADVKKLQDLSKDLELGLKKVKKILMNSKFGSAEFSNCPPFRK